MAYRGCNVWYPTKNWLHFGSGRLLHFIFKDEEKMYFEWLAFGTEIPRSCRLPGWGRGSERWFSFCINIY